jgi:prepilin-type N-terminal cleavage/methylation domain-containing protein
MTRPRQQWKRNMPARLRRHGFTLVELLVVIAIIAVLAAILVPVIGKVRDNARAADTRAQIGTLSALMQAYYGDHNAYPGPLSNMQVNADMSGLSKPVIAAPSPNLAGSADLPAAQAGKITGNENAVLGLLGGLRATGAVVNYETQWVGTGPGWLGVTIKKIPPYGDTASLSLRTDAATELTGDYADDEDPMRTGEDTNIPEFVDRFPSPMPLLILRARTGQRSTATLPGSSVDNPVVTNGTDPRRIGQYDLSQIEGYVKGTAATSIGSGKQMDLDEYHGGTAVNEHGFQTADPTQQGRHLADGSDNTAWKHPYDAHVAFRNPAAPNTPKQKDGFIIIGAGVDRIYGTNDDITNFGPYQ